MDEATSMGRFIRESRLQQGMSLGQLAATVGRSPSSVRRWERDEVAPATAVVPQLAVALDVDVSALEERRPDVADPDPSVVDHVEEKKFTTVEQPAAPSQETPVVPAVKPERKPRVGIIGEMWNSIFAEKESWIGWVRGIGTALVLLLFFLVLVWAGGEFIDAVSDVWHSFGSDSSTAP
jgi:transcriptional regulator with XRE-family HTH domain